MPAPKTLPALVLAAVLVPLLVATALGWRSYAAAWLPVHRWTVQRLLPDFVVQRFELVRTGRETYLRLDAAPRRAMVIGGRVVAPTTHVQVAVPAAHAAAHAALVAVVMLAFAFQYAAAPLRLAAAGVGALTLAEVLDLPLCLAGGVWDVLQQAAQGSPPQGAMLAALGAFFDNGGRYAFAIVVTLLAARQARGAGRPWRRKPAAA
jgi:hypothetical protein